MRLIDKSAWIEWLIGSPTGKAVQAELPTQEAWLVPTIVQLELAKWLTREVSADKCDEVIAFTQMYQISELDTTLALAAAALCRKHKLATADAVVYATALEHGADLVTCDAHFGGLPGITLIEKIAGT